MVPPRMAEPALMTPVPRLVVLEAERVATLMTVLLVLLVRFHRLWPSRKVTVPKASETPVPLLPM